MIKGLCENKAIKVVVSSSGCSPMLRWGSHVIKEEIGVKHVGVIGGVQFYTHEYATTWNQKTTTNTPMDYVVLEPGVSLFDLSADMRKDPNWGYWVYGGYAYCHPEFYAKVDKIALGEAIKKALEEL